MNKRLHFTRLTGIVYIVAAVFGLIIALGGLIVLWSTRPSVVRYVNEAVGLMGTTISATQNTISVLDTSLQQAGADLDSVQALIQNVNDTLTGSQSMIHDTAGLVGTNVVNFVDNTRASLDSVQQSATVVDNMLRTITGIPLIGPWLGGQRYNPPVPLGQSVANVSNSMAPLPDALSKIQTDLNATSTNIDTVKTELGALSKQIDAVRITISQARQVTNVYSGVLNDIQTRYQSLSSRVPGILIIAYLVATVLLLWILLTQIGMLIHGIDMLQESEEHPLPPLPPPFEENE